MTNPSQSIIVIVVSRTLARLIQVFGLYVIIHGHYSPGGGFQGGALLAAGVLLLRMTEGMRETQQEMSSQLAMPLAGIGALIFAGLGLLAIPFGGNYLDYGVLPGFGFEEAKIRFYAILLIEVGVGLAVATALVSIFDDMLGMETGGMKDTPEENAPAKAPVPEK